VTSVTPCTGEGTGPLDKEGTGPQTRLRPGGLVRSAYACGTRTFVKSAAACVDSSEMPLTMAVVAGDSTYSSATWSGTFRVMSLVFGPGSGMLSLSCGDLYLQANVSPDGSVTNVHLYPASYPAPTDLPTVSLARL
jgi:hypothetical protein